ncbi:MAG: hypothetical protein QM785_16685 [Pyrinomonadaceae bacterium]
MSEKTALIKPRSCYKCGYFAETADVKCPNCGRILHTTTATRIRGLLMMLCGVFLFAIVGYISIWMLDVIYNSGPGKARFNGTEQEKYGILALFATILIFAVGSFLTGVWQAAFGRRNKTLSWILIGVAVLIYVGGGLIAVLYK